MAAVNAQQIRKIYAIGHTLGIVDRTASNEDDLHQLIESITGKDSIRKLSTAEADSVIAELQRRQGRPAVKRKTSSATPGGATAGQQRKVWALMYQLASYDKDPSSATLGERLCGILKKDFKRDATPQKPFAWLNYHECNRLIESLKKYVGNAARRSGDSSG